MSGTFTPTSLPYALRVLFELNNYEVTGPVQVHGAEIDLVARSKSDPFATPIYIEATVEYVDNDKYGKDVGKLAMIGELEPGARRLIISSKGFSLPVMERARATRIETLTYAQLYARFERFEPYLEAATSDGPIAAELRALDAIYEEPRFLDAAGHEESATDFLTDWRDSVDASRRWLIVVGEYGTGKTALTKVLQHRWARDCMIKPGSPVPLRVELRDFTRQFDARGLLHHFLDHNQLGHVPIDFVLSLLGSGRVVLLLDGYDEMAQYMNSRERRACLVALGELARGGAKGIMTSRPNYFSESEEFHVFETLYSSIRSGAIYLTKDDEKDVLREKDIDELLLHQFINRYERTLKDLSPEQTEALVERALAHDAEGRNIVLSLLRRIFRRVEEGSSVSLSGKPVIISYLLEVVETLKAQSGKSVSVGEADSGLRGGGDENAALSEWQIYKLIVDQLMMRDYKRSPYVMPGRRREFLRSVSVRLSKRDTTVFAEADFRDLIRKEFKNELRMRLDENREEEVERLFADLRSSATLTRSTDASRPGWRFSHNSLREFLLTEHLVTRLESDDLGHDSLPISDAMRTFVASRPIDATSRLVKILNSHWAERRSSRNVGLLLVLIWDAALRLFATQQDPVRACLRAIGGDPIAMDSIAISRVRLSSEDRASDLSRTNFSNGEYIDVGFAGAVLVDADFSGSLFESTTFAFADLSNASFRQCMLGEVDMAGALVRGASFAGLDTASTILVAEGGNVELRVRLTGQFLLGYLRYHGAATDDVASFYVLRQHPKFGIIDKIVRKLAEQAHRERRGLVQRGAARQDIRLANDFVDHLDRHGYVASPRGREYLTVTDKGRDAFGRWVDKNEVVADIEHFFAALS